MYPNGLPSVDGGSAGSWRHEDGSVRMLRHLLLENNISLQDYGLEERDQHFIEEVIAGTELSNRRGRDADKFFLYGAYECLGMGSVRLLRCGVCCIDIVNNLRSGLDVDKLDYFQVLPYLLPSPV